MNGPAMKNPVYADQRGSNIIVYQAYSKAIGRAAATSGTLRVPGFLTSRMTWIKPSFLWMMYRSGWGHKDTKQACILKIYMEVQSFRRILEYATPTSFNETNGLDYAEWRRSLRSRPNRVQWDPDRDIWGAPLERKAIQVGIAPTFIDCYLNSITEIQDITEYCGLLEPVSTKGKLPSPDIPMEPEI